MKCRNCGKEFKIITNGTECPSCYTQYVFTPEERAALYNEATSDEAKRRFSAAAIKYKFLSYDGVTEAEYRFAECKEYGRGTKQDINGAVELYRKTAKKMLPEGAYAIYRIMNEKKSRDRSRGEALYRLRIAAELGSTQAAEALAYCYESGELSGVSGLDAAYWYEKAAKAVGGEPALVLAEMYLDGEVLERNCFYASYYVSKAENDKKLKKQVKRLLRRIGECEAIEPDGIVLPDRSESLYDLALEAELRSELDIAFYFLLRSAELGYTRAQYRVAQCYEKGVGVAKSPELTAKWYEKASREGHLDSILALAECYRTGFGVEKSNEKCVEYYRVAAETGDAASMYLLADTLFSGKLCKKNIPEAVKLYQKSALKTYAPAIHKINEIFDAFTKVFNAAVEAQKDGDNERAVKLYTAVADMGHRASACNLGYCYQNGIGCKKNLRTAVHYYRLAAEEGSATAKFNLGMCYKNGGGVNVDFRMAEKLLTEARDAGFYDDATRLLNEIAERRQKKRARAIYSAATEVYRRGEVANAIKLRAIAAKMGSARAEYVLGCHFEYGDGLPKDIDRAKQYYKLAREHGFRDILLEMKVGFLRERRLLEYRK